MAPEATPPPRRIHASTSPMRQGRHPCRTNNPNKMQSLSDYGIEVVAQVPLITGINTINKNYMTTKKEKFNHML